MIPFSESLLAERRILVTGGSSGLGRSTAMLLSRLGARVAIAGRNEERLQETIAQLHGQGHTVHRFDFASTEDSSEWIKTVAAEGGALAGVFHAAGIEAIRPLLLAKAALFEEVLASSVKAALGLARGFSARGVADTTPTGTSLVFMSSVASVRGQVGLSMYSAAKAAVDGLVRSLACELSSRRIRVNSIVAGAVKTEMHENIARRLPKESLDEYDRRHLFGFGEPEDVANAAGFLLSPASKWITGTSLVVDGGYTCR